MCMGDFRLMPLFQDSKFLVKNVGARAHLQHWLLRPCLGETNYHTGPEEEGIFSRHICLIIYFRVFVMYPGHDSYIICLFHDNN